MSGEDPREPWKIELNLTVRPCAREDLEKLEWFGTFTPHREIIHQAYKAQESGDNLMLLAVANGFPVAQAWVDLAKHRPEPVGLLWAVRVFPVFQGMGIGTRLLREAEREMQARGVREAEIGVEKDNEAARRLYERLGYRVVAEVREEYEFTPPGGERVRAYADQWMLRKPLAGEGDQTPERG